MGTETDTSVHFYQHEDILRERGMHTYIYYQSVFHFLKLLPPLFNLLLQKRKILITLHGTFHRRCGMPEKKNNLF